MGIKSFFQKIYKALAWFVARPGIEDFLRSYENQAVSVIAQHASANSNSSFHQWKDQTFAELKKITGEARDNWIAILLHLAYENYKAARE